MKTRQGLTIAVASLGFLLLSALPARALPKPDYPVIFIHGLAGSADGTWGEFRDFLSANGWTFGGTPTYDPATGQVSAVSDGGLLRDEHVGLECSRQFPEPYLARTGLRS